MRRNDRQDAINRLREAQGSGRGVFDERFDRDYVPAPRYVFKIGLVGVALNLILWVAIVGFVFIMLNVFGVI